MEFHSIPSIYGSKQFVCYITINQIKHNTENIPIIFCYNVLTQHKYLSIFSGLCNSRKIDRLLAKYKSTRSNCDVCHEGMNKMSKMIKALNKNDVLDKGLEMCGQYLGSYSDACKLSLLENFEDLYE